MLRVDYRSTDRRAILKWAAADLSLGWVDVLKRLIFDRAHGPTQDGPCELSLPWWSFVALRTQLLELFRGFDLQLGRNLEVSQKAARLLAQSTRIALDYNSAIEANPLSQSAVISRLKKTGFARKLSAPQLRNVSKMAPLSSAATFSVPGAGKTTEALAYFFLKATPSQRLLVVAPKNAFAAWDEQLQDCVPMSGVAFTRLRGGVDRIPALLAANPRFMLISYQQLTRVSDILAAHCAEFEHFVFLDESHRIKSGVAKVTARATLDLSHLPVGKLIMSGTPMPQSVDDLIPQFMFLYPEIPVDVTSVINLIRPVYVRTNKKELGLPPVTRNLISLPMAPVQHELYRLMRSEVAREASTALSLPSKQAFRSLGRSVARLLQFVSNPALLTSQFNFAHPELLAASVAEGDGPKLKYVLRRARQLVKSGHKVLIWSSWVRNVEYIAQRLADVGAVYIHGSVDAGDEDDDETREGRIRLFHDDPTVKVMVANPAAASEGISLHRICHHALYLDRTFNAAHYLQSEDRIHRFGLAKKQSTIIEIVECAHTVDEIVRTRLNFKIRQMADALNDSSLRPDPIPIDPNEIEDYEEYSMGLAPDEIQALLNGLVDED